MDREENRGGKEARAIAILQLQIGVLPAQRGPCVLGTAEVSAKVLSVNVTSLKGNARIVGEMRGDLVLLQEPRFGGAEMPLGKRVGRDAVGCFAQDGV